MNRLEKLTILEHIIRIQDNCQFYEDEGRTEALKQECGRLSAILYIASELGIKTDFCFHNCNKYLEMGVKFRSKEDQEAIERYKKTQKEKTKNVKK